MRPGVPTRIEHTYRRHGTVATLAGLDVRTGQVTLIVRRRRRHQELLELLQAIRRRWPRGRLIIVADNLSVHTHPAVKACWNSNQTDLLDGGFEANFKLLKDQIGQVHMRDLFLEEYPWRALITNLAAMKFQGYCFAEIPESTDGVRVMHYFRGMFRAYQGLTT